MKLKGVLIEIDGKNHKVSLDDARKLYDQLDELFAKQVTINPLEIIGPGLYPPLYPPFVPTCRPNTTADTLPTTWITTTTAGGTMESVDIGPAFN